VRPNNFLVTSPLLTLHSRFILYLRGLNCIWAVSSGCGWFFPRLLWGLDRVWFQWYNFLPSRHVVFGPSKASRASREHQSSLMSRVNIRQVAPVMIQFSSEHRPQNVFLERMANFALHTALQPKCGVLQRICNEIHRWRCMRESKGDSRLELFSRRLISIKLCLKGILKLQDDLPSPTG